MFCNSRRSRRRRKIWAGLGRRDQGRIAGRQRFKRHGSGGAPYVLLTQILADYQFKFLLTLFSPRPLPRRRVATFFIIKIKGKGYDFNRFSIMRSRRDRANDLRVSERKAIRERFCKIVVCLLTIIIAKSYSWLLLRENGCEIPGQSDKISKNGHGYRCTARSNEISPTSKDSQAARSTDLRASRGHFQTQAVRIQHEIMHSQ